MKTLLVCLLIGSVLLSGCIFFESVTEVPEELDIPVLGMTSREACSSYKYLGDDEIQYYYNYLGVDQNLFWQAWGLQRYGSIRIVGERTSLGHTIDTREERIHECYYEMLRVCDSDFVCQDYSKRFLVKESELGDWCQEQCYS